MNFINKIIMGCGWFDEQ